MRKSIEQTYKYHQHVIKEIEKEQSQLVRKSKIFKQKSNPTGKIPSMTVKYGSSPNISKLSSEHARMVCSYSDKTKLPRVHVQVPDNRQCTGSPRIERRQLQGQLDKSLSRSLGNLETVTMPLVRCHTHQSAERIASLEGLQSRTLLQPCLERARKQRLSNSVSFDFENKQSDLKTIGLGGDYFQGQGTQDTFKKNALVLQRQKSNKF